MYGEWRTAVQIRRSALAPRVCVLLNGRVMPLSLFKRAQAAPTQTKNRLHIGCGPVLLEGWINVDISPYPGIDAQLDIREGLPYRDLAYVFAEHFIEHLSYEEGSRFLSNCRQAMQVDGVLRLSTPNLDWVWMTQYHLGNWQAESEAVRDCFWMNKAFRGWGHQFLYNVQTLTATIVAAGFGKVDVVKYGESSHDALRGLERHEQYPDSPQLPHIIVVEASGYSSTTPEMLKGPLDDYTQAINAK